MKKNRITGADFKVNLERISFSLSSSTHEDEDFMVVKNLKSVISNELIESSLPPSAKNTEDSASTEKMIISCNIKSIRGDLGDNIVKLVRMYDGLSNLSDTNLKTTSVKHDVKPKLIQGVLLVDRTDTNIHLDGKRLILRSFRNRFSTFMERVPSKSETKVSLAATCASSEASLGKAWECSIIGKLVERWCTEFLSIAISRTLDNKSCSKVWWPQCKCHGFD